MADNVVFGQAVVELLGDDTKLRQAMAAATQSLAQQAGEMERQMTAKFRAIGLGAMAIGAGLLGAAKDMAFTAARTETLGIALDTVGKTAGYAKDEIAAYEEAIKKKGITTQEARLALIKFMQSELDAADAAKLARVAQDLAVIAAQNSSEAFEQLTQAINAQRPVLLKEYGIVMGLEEIYGRFGKQLGIVREEVDSTGQTQQVWLRDLTEAEKKQAFLNVILEEGAKVAGVYENAMNTAGKRMTSLARYIEETKNALGEVLLPTLLAIIKAVEGVLKFILALPEPLQRLAGAAIAAGGAMLFFGGSIMTTLAPRLAQLAIGTKALMADVAALANLYRLQGASAVQAFTAALAANLAMYGPLAIAAAAAAAAIAGIVLAMQEAKARTEEAMQAAQAYTEQYVRMTSEVAPQFRAAYQGILTAIEQHKAAMIETEQIYMQQSVGLVDLTYGYGSLEDYLYATNEAYRRHADELARLTAVTSLYIGTLQDQGEHLRQLPDTLQGMTLSVKQAEEAQKALRDNLVATVSDIISMATEGGQNLAGIVDRYAADARNIAITRMKDAAMAEREYQMQRAELIAQYNAQIAAYEAAGNARRAQELRAELTRRLQELARGHQIELTNTKAAQMVEDRMRKIAMLTELRDLQLQTYRKIALKVQELAYTGKIRMADYEMLVKALGLQTDAQLKAAEVEHAINKALAEDEIRSAQNFGEAVKAKIEAIARFGKAIAQLEQEIGDMQTQTDWDAFVASLPMPDFNQMYQDLTADLGNLGQTAQQTEQTAIEPLEDTVSKAAQAINAAFEMFAKLTGYIHRDYKPKLQQFADDVVGVIVEMVHAAWKLGDATHDWHDFVKAAADFAEGAGQALSLIGQGVDALTALRKYKAVVRSTLTQFVDDLLFAVKEVIRASEQVNREGLTNATLFASGANAVSDMLSRGMETLGALYAFRARPLPVARLRTIVQGVRQIIEQVVATLGDVDAAGVAAVVQPIGEVMNSFGTVVDALAKVQGFDTKGVTAVKILAIVNATRNTLSALWAAFKHLLTKEGDDWQAWAAGGAFTQTVEAIGGAVGGLKQMIETLEAVGKYTTRVSYPRIVSIVNATRNTLSALWAAFRHLLSRDRETRDWQEWAAGSAFKQTVEAISGAVGAVKAMVETLEAMGNYDARVSFPRIVSIVNATRNALSALWAAFKHLLSRDEAKEWHEWAAGGAFAQTVKDVTEAVGTLKTVVETLKAVQEWTSGGVGRGKVEAIVGEVRNALGALWNGLKHLLQGKAGEWREWAAGQAFAATVKAVTDAVGTLKTIVETLKAVQEWTPGALGRGKVDAIVSNVRDALGALWGGLKHLLSRDTAGDWREWAAGGAFAQTVKAVTDAVGTLKTIVETLAAVREYRATQIGGKVQAIVNGAREALSALWAGFKHLLSRDTEGDWQAWSAGGAFAQTVKNITEAVSTLKTIVETLGAVQAYKPLPAAQGRKKMEDIVNSARDMLSALWAGFKHLLSRDEEGDWKEWAAGGAFAQTVKSVTDAIGTLKTITETLTAVQAYKAQPEALAQGKMAEIIEGARRMLSALWEGFKHLLSRDEMGDWKEWAAGGAFSQTMRNIADAVGTLKTFLDVMDAAAKWKSYGATEGVVYTVLEGARYILNELQRVFGDLITWREGQPEVWGKEFAETMGNVEKSVNAVKAMLEVVAALAKWRPAALEERKVRLLVENIRYVIARFYDAFKDIISQDTDEAIDKRMAEVAEHWSKVIATVKEMLTVGGELGGYRGVTTAAIDRLVTDLATIVTKVSEKAKELEGIVDWDLAGKLAEIGQKIGSAVNALLDPFKGLYAFVPIPTASIDAFAGNVGYLVAAMAQAGESITDEQIERAQGLAETFGRIAEALKGSAEMMQAVMGAAWARVYEKIGILVADMVEAIIYLDRKAKLLREQGWDIDAVEELAGVFNTVASGLKAAVDAYNVLWFWRPNVAASAAVVNFTNEFVALAAVLADAYEKAKAQGNMFKAMEYLSWADLIGQLMKRAFENIMSIQYTQYDWGRYKALGRAIMQGISEGILENLGLIQAALEEMMRLVLSIVDDMGYQAGLTWWNGFVDAVRDNLNMLTNVLGASAIVNASTMAGQTLGAAAGVTFAQNVSVSVPVEIAGPIVGRSGLSEVAQLLANEVLRIVDNELGRRGVVLAG